MIFFCLYFCFSEILKRGCKQRDVNSLYKRSYITCYETPLVVRITFFLLLSYITCYEAPLVVRMTFFLLLSYITCYEAPLVVKMTFFLLLSHIHMVFGNAKCYNTAARTFTSSQIWFLAMLSVIIPLLGPLLALKYGFWQC